MKSLEDVIREAVTEFDDSELNTEPARSETVADAVRKFYDVVPVTRLDVHPLTWDVLRFFAYDHLPEHMVPFSKPFHDVAHAQVRACLLYTSPSPRDRG